MTGFDRSLAFDIYFNRTITILVIWGVCGLVYANSVSMWKMYQLAMRDPLTDTINRRHFMELLQREHQRAERYGAPYALLMIDIDHFKQVNDRHGHQIGDRAILAMADCCRALSRPTDIIARYGGEEFVLALPETGLAGAEKFAERLRASVETLTLKEAPGLRLTVSIGVSMFQQSTSFEQLIAAADASLYNAKAAGRNRICVSEIAAREDKTLAL